MQHLVSSESLQPSMQFQYVNAGAPARTVGWRHPGYIHTSYLKDLWPDSLYVIFLSYLISSGIRINPATEKTWLLQHCRYTYRLGHRLPNGSRIWSKSYSFKASPYPGQDSLQRVVIFGDMGKVDMFFHLYPSLIHTEALCKCNDSSF